MKTISTTTSRAFTTAGIPFTVLNRRATGRTFSVKSLETTVLSFVVNMLDGTYRRITDGKVTVRKVGRIAGYRTYAVAYTERAWGNLQNVAARSSRRFFGEN